MVIVREETPEDVPDIDEVNRLAFGGTDESQLVNRLRSDGSVVISLVALVEDAVAGHILFSELPIHCGERRILGAALAPMAVRPEFQNRGIGSQLVEAGIVACRNRGIDVIVVLGHPAFYPRFGFSAQAARSLAAPFSGEAFMSLELRSGALNGNTGTVTYAPAFGIHHAEGSQLRR